MQSGGLEAAGRYSDLDDEQGQKVWKNLKANRLGFSFGYVATRSRKRQGGGRELIELDVFEISATPSPMNNRTRVLSTKSASMDDYDLMSHDELREASLALISDIETRPVRVARFKC